LKTYKDTSTTLSGRALATEAFNLAIGVDFVVLQNRHFSLLTLVLDFLGGLRSEIGSTHHEQKNKHAYVVGLLLALLSTAAETKDKMKGRFFLDIVVA